MKKLIILCLFVFMSGIILADNADLSPEEAFGRIFSAEKTDPEKYFAGQFLKAVPSHKIDEIVGFYTSSLGSYLNCEKNEKGYRLNFSKGNAQATIHIDSDNKIASLWFGAPELSDDSLEKLKKDFSAASGKISVCLVRDNSETLLAINPDQPLACGSSFKLYLLKALEEEIAAKKRQWSDLVELREEWKSFPSGILQDWPAGSRHTLETLAGLMISISDNTATDHIFRLLGMETLRRHFPETCKDILNTSQLLKMKFLFPQQAQQYIKGDATRKAEIIAEMDSIAPAAIASYAVIFSIGKPTLVDELEWFISTRSLCQAIYELRNSSLIKINPAAGLVDKKDWHCAGFKGGSEPGVLNYTWVLQKTPAGPIYTLSCTFNSNETSDTAAFNALTGRLLKLLEKM